MTDEERAKYKNMVQLPLPFDFWEEEKAAEEEARKREEQKRQERLAREKEGLKFYDTARSDNQKLMNYQYEFKHGDVKALDPMYELLQEIGMRYIGTLGKKNRHVRNLCWSDKQAKAADAASYIIEQYITREDFIIKTSVTGYLWLRICAELFYRTKADEIVDFVDLALFFKEGTEDQEEME